MTVATRAREAAEIAIDRSATRRWVDAWRLVLIVGCCLAIYAAFIPQIIRYLDPLTGDEPFYVMTAISLAYDRDLNEINNYQRRDFDSFYPPDPLPEGWQGWPNFPRTLPPHMADSARAGLYSKHGLGVAALITIPYVWGGQIGQETAQGNGVALPSGRGGRIGVMLFLNAVAALVAVNMVLLARRYGLGWVAAVALMVPLAFSNPLMSYAYLIFPEMFAALAIIYAFRRSREPENNAAQWFGVGLALATLPWLHARFVPAILGLVALLVVGWWRERSWGRRLAGLLPPAISAVGLFSYYLIIYHRPWPSADDHAGFNWPHQMLNAAFGLFLDEQWGLLIYAPLYLLAGAGMITLWQRWRGEAGALLAVLLPYLAMIAFYRVWWGEWGPPARYLAPIVPLAIAPIAAWVGAVRRPVAAGTVALLALPGLAMMGGFLKFPQLMYNHPTGHSALFTSWAAQFERTWPKVIPSFQLYSPSPLVARSVWSLVLIGLVCALALMGYIRPFARIDVSADEESPPTPR
jgi:hypothetical protein